MDSLMSDNAQGKTADVGGPKSGSVFIANIEKTSGGIKSNSATIP